MRSWIKLNFSTLFCCITIADERSHLATTFSWELRGRPKGGIGEAGGNNGIWNCHYNYYCEYVPSFQAWENICISRLFFCFFLSCTAVAQSDSGDNTWDEHSHWERIICHLEKTVFTHLSPLLWPLG